MAKIIDLEGLRTFYEKLKKTYVSKGTLKNYGIKGYETVVDSEKTSTHAISYNNRIYVYFRGVEGTTTKVFIQQLFTESDRDHRGPLIELLSESLTDKEKYYKNPYVINNLPEGTTWLVFIVRVNGNNKIDPQAWAQDRKITVKRYFYAELTYDEKNGAIGSFSVAGDLKGVEESNHPVSWQMFGIEPVFWGNNDKSPVPVSFEDVSKMVEKSYWNVPSPLSTPGHLFLRIPYFKYNVSKVGTKVTVYVTNNPQRKEQTYYDHAFINKYYKIRRALYIGLNLLSKQNGSYWTTSAGTIARDGAETIRTALKSQNPNLCIMSLAAYNCLQTIFLFSYRGIDPKLWASGRLGGNLTVANGNQAFFYKENSFLRYLGIEDFWGGAQVYLDYARFQNNAFQLAYNAPEQPHYDTTNDWKNWFPNTANINGWVDGISSKGPDCFLPDRIFVGAQSPNGYRASGTIQSLTGSIYTGGGTRNSTIHTQRTSLFSFFLSNRAPTDVGYRIMRVDDEDLFGDTIGFPEERVKR